MRTKLSIYSLKFPLLCIVVFICMFNSLHAQSAEEIYSSANTLYKNKNYEQAVALYEKILAQGYRNAEIYYNLANCYYKLNNTGKAILNFERANKLAPDDEDIAHNLKLAQLRAVDKITPIPQLSIITAWNTFTTSRSSKSWSIFSLVFVWVAFLLLAVYFLIVKKNVILFPSILLIIFSAVCVALAVKQQQVEEYSDWAILIVSNAGVKSAPDEQSTNLFTIHEGIKLQIVDGVSSWSKVRLADGKVGWLEKNVIEKI